MIPKKIHYCWFGGGELPKSAKKCIKSWKKYCPDYEIIEWNENNLDMHINAFAEKAYQEKVWGFVPDFYRLWIIYNFGGIYLDTDVEIVKNMDFLLNHSAFCGMESPIYEGGESFVNFGQGFGAEKGNPIIKEHLEIYDEIPTVDNNGNLNKIVSPKLTTELLLRHGLDRTADKIQELNGITVYPFEYFCPKDFITGEIVCTPNTYSIHHFDATWFDEKTQKKKIDSWKKHKKARNIDYIKHLPNLVLLKVLGDKNYNALKNKIKK